MSETDRLMADDQGKQFRDGTFVRTMPRAMGKTTKMMQERIAELQMQLKHLTEALADADEYNKRLREQLRLEQRPWTVELTYDDGENPFSRKQMKIIDVGVSDHILVVGNDEVEQALKESNDE